MYLEKNSLLIIITAIVGGLLVGGAVLYLHISYSRQINALNTLNKNYSERISEWQEKAGDLMVKQIISDGEKSDLEEKLREAQQTIKGLEWQIKDATRESIRVEEKFTERLNEATAEAEGLQIQSATLQQKLEKEVASRKVAEAQVKEMWVRFNDAVGESSKIREQIGYLEEDRAKLVKILKESRSGMWDAWDQLRVAKKLVESALVQETRPVAVEDSKVVKTVVFVPADIKLSIADVDRYRVATGRMIRLNQLVFFSQLGETFSAGEPAIFTGKKKLAEYDRMPVEKRIIEIRKEMNVPWEETFIVLLVGSNDDFNYGTTFPPTALITGETVGHILEGYYGGTAVVTHELGHVWGLDHSLDPGSIMAAKINIIYASYPFIKFTKLESDTLRSNLKKK